MWLIVGLGNPGSKYALHRHNIGFMAIDTFVNSAGNPPEKSEHKALTYHITLHNDETKTSEKAILCKPQTFMNLSGDSVRGLCDFYKIDLQHVVVLHDEVDFPFGVLKIQKERGHGGHNGIRDIHEKMADNKYFRIKMGIGRPSGKMEMANHVLANFSKEEFEKIPDFLNTALDAVESLIFKGYEKTATKFNTATAPAT
jgi:peptidyl-tRNA hydrolase, PTH1 family